MCNELLEGVLRVTHLIEFLELNNLEENVFQNVLGIPLIFIQLQSHSQNFTTLPHVEFQIIICTCEWNRFNKTCLYFIFYQQSIICLVSTELTFISELC